MCNWAVVLAVGLHNLGFAFVRIQPLFTFSPSVAAIVSISGVVFLAVASGCVKEEPDHRQSHVCLYINLCVVFPSCRTLQVIPLQLVLIIEMKFSGIP